MATTFKTFQSSDVVTARTLLHEALPLPETISSGTYAENNIKNFSHGMFQSVYDYPYLSSSANHIFDLTCGYSHNSSLSSSNCTLNSKKINIYNQMAQLLVGYNESGSIREFDQDGDLAGGTKLKEVFFMNFSRLLTKDEIKKGSFSMTLITGGLYSAPNNGDLVINDSGAVNDYRVNSPAGEYGVLYDASSARAVSDPRVGLIYYQAGIAVLTASVFGDDGGFTGSYKAENGNNYPLEFGVKPSGIAGTTAYFGTATSGSGNDVYTSIAHALMSGSISGSCNGFRNRLKTLSFNNTTELNSTIYFCRVNHNDFNYSSNPTYLSGSKLRVKTNTTDNPVTYITTIGLYSADNALLATAKLSEPLKKDPTTELTLRVRLDY